MSEQNINRNQDSSWVAKENFRDATNFIDENLGTDPASNSEFLRVDVQLPNNGYARKSGLLDGTQDGKSIHASSLTFNSKESVSGDIYALSDASVVSRTSAKSAEDAPFVSYKSSTNSLLASTTVSREHRNKITGEKTQYTHVFKSPEAARLVTKLAMKRIEGLNPDISENKQDAA